MQYLISSKASFEHATQYGLTALHYAASGGYEDCVEMLHEHGADLNLCSPFYGTPLCVAVLNGHLHVVRYLLKGRANPNIAVKGLGSAVHAAAAFGHADILTSLLDHGADYRAYQWIRSRLHSIKDVFKVVLPHESRNGALSQHRFCQPLMAAVVSIQLRTIDVLLAHGALATTTHYQNTTAFSVSSVPDPSPAESTNALYYATTLLQDTGGHEQWRVIKERLEESLAKKTLLVVGLGNAKATYLNTLKEQTPLKFVPWVSGMHQTDMSASLHELIETGKQLRTSMYSN